MAEGDGQGRPAEAESHYREALSTMPDYYAARNNLGALLAKLQRLDEAELELRLAVDLEPTSAQARANLAKVLSANEKEAEAARHTRIAAALAGASGQEPGPGSEGQGSPRLAEPAAVQAGDTE